jgi:NAD(P)H-hydrate epimerase
MVDRSLDEVCLLTSALESLKLAPLLSAQQAQQADAYTIERIGIPGIVLMEHAGRAVAEQARILVPGLSRALVLAGPGNNGGDGWVCARHLWSSGVLAPVATLLPSTKRKSAANAS